MKKRLTVGLTLCLLLTSLVLSVRADYTDSNNRLVKEFSVYTPKGSAVAASSNTGEMTAAEISSSANIKTQYEAKGAVQVADPSLLYNCHSFAWYDRDSANNAVWIDDPQTFIDDGSYVEVDQPVLGALIAYYEYMEVYQETSSADGTTVKNILGYNTYINHSGVIVDVYDDMDASTNPGMEDVTVLSKWGRTGLFEHNALVCPYVAPQTRVISYSSGTDTYIKYHTELADIRYYVVNPDNYASKDMQDGASVTDGAVRNGLYTDADDEIRYYANGEVQHAGLVSDGEGNYYYINGSGTAVKDTVYEVSAFKSNGLLPEGCYTFDQDGKIVELPVVLSSEDGNGYMNGLIRMPDGELRYMQNGVPTHAGVVKDTDGNYYYINSTRKGVTNTLYGIGTYYANGSLPATEYTLNADGMIVDLPEVLDNGDPNDLGNGLLRLADGTVVFCENGQYVHKGLVADQFGNYYYINSTFHAVTGMVYTVYPAFSNGLLTEEDELTFNESGHLVNEELLPTVETETSSTVETETSSTVETETSSTVETETSSTVEAETSSTVEAETSSTVETETSSTVETEALLTAETE